MPPLTIRKPETLLARLEAMETQALDRAADTNEKTAVKVRINGFDVQSVVTPSVNPGRFYRLFYVNGKRTAKGAVPTNLLP